MEEIKNTSLAMMMGLNVNVPHFTTIAEHGLLLMGKLKTPTDLVFHSSWFKVLVKATVKRLQRKLPQAKYGTKPSP